MEPTDQEETSGEWEVEIQLQDQVELTQMQMKNQRYNVIQVQVLEHLEAREWD